MYITALPFLSSFIIVFINYFIQVFFQKLSIFEKYKNLTEELSSRISKIVFALFINTGLLLLLINIKFNVGSDSMVPSSLMFLVKGQYSDLTSEWFRNVGTVIIMTMFMNIVGTPIIVLLF